MSMYECRFHKKKYPQEGEMVVGKVVSIDTEGVRVNLVEYGDAHGLILLGELSKKRIKNINQITKVGNIEVCITLRVDDDKGYIDLSIAKVNEIEKDECKKTYMKNKISHHIMVKASRILHKDVQDLYNTFGYDKAIEFGSLYYFFARVKEDTTILQDTQLECTIKTLINDEFQASTYKVRADIEVTCPSGQGINAIKDAFTQAVQEDSKLRISLLNTPTYSIVRISSDKDKAYKAVQDACTSIERHVTQNKGSVIVINKPKLYGEKSKYALLTLDSEESDSE